MKIVSAFYILITTGQCLTAAAAYEAYQESIEASNECVTDRCARVYLGIDGLIAITRDIYVNRRY